jgi:hypothetical protein
LCFACYNLLVAYFSQRELAQTPRSREDLTTTAWAGIFKAINSRIYDGSFGRAFPQECSNCIVTVGTNQDLMSAAVTRELVYLTWPLDDTVVPTLYDALDLIQFCWTHVAEPMTGKGHCNYVIRHLAFDDELGRERFASVINGVFAREGLAFHLDDNGEVNRVAPLVLSEALASSVFHSGDRELVRLLEEARNKFLSHDERVRRESLEKLWDAWERLKSIENPAPDKKSDSVTKLLDRVTTEPRFRQVLEVETRALTGIGNDFMIRHTEMSKVPIASVEQVDFLFHRMFAIIRLLLRSTNRGG